MSSSAASPREGRIVTANMLERATLDLLARRLVAYGNAVAVQDGTDAPVPPRSYTCVAQVDRWAEDQLPAIVVVSPGTTVPPELRGGSYDAVFALAVSVYCSASTEAATHALVRMWCGAIRACLTQAPSIDGWVSDLRLVSERYDELPIEDRRTYVDGTVSFEARCDEIVDTYAGPLDPPDGLDDWTTVAETEIEIVKEAPDG